MSEGSGRCHNCGRSKREGRCLRCGRPRLDLTERRDRFVGVWVSEGEMAEIARRATAMKMKSGAFLREVGLGSRLAPPAPEINREAWRKLAGSLATFNRLAGRREQNSQIAFEDGLLLEVRDLLVRLRSDLSGLSHETEDHQ
jgi:hypothetical protein